MNTTYYFYTLDIKDLVKTKVLSPDTQIHIKIDLSKVSFIDRLLGKKVELLQGLSIEVEK